MKVSCSIFIPAYNAEKTITDVISRIDHETWQHIDKVFVVNDGSLDNTVAIVNQQFNNCEKLKLFSFKNNHGYGNAVSKGIQLCLETPADYIVCLHADGQYPPEYILQFLKYMDERGIDILQGSRHKNNTALTGGMPFYKYLAGKCLVWFENIIFRLDMTDYHSGFMFYRRDAVEKIPFSKLSNSFDIDLEIIALGRILDLNISEKGIPTCYADEKSYLNPISYGMRVLRILFRYCTGYYEKNILVN